MATKDEGDGRMLACERHGSGEPLVLVHGVTHRRQTWYPVLDLLTEHREVILVDLPGHGESPELVHDGRPVEDVLRDEFKAFLDDQGLDRPHVAGNSLGGRIALEAGANGHARSVTALSPAGFWRTDGAFAYTRRIFTSAAALVERLGPRAEHLAQNRAGRQLMYGALMSHPMRVSCDQALGDIRGFRYAIPALRRLLAAATPFTGEIPRGVPVTIAWAGRDLVLPPWQAEVARAMLPDAEHVTMRGAGHVPMSDDPKCVARILLRGSAPVASVAPLTLVGGTATRRKRAATA
ncbi:MAG TPA: alpha/beta fold hydrolase [Jatrophihabitantaceae bacterium]|nr:alpha/beta fold hydrolase [Jatrophihabitantaceae bacterium]